MELPHNSSAEIKAEILDPETIKLMAKSVGLSSNDLASIQIAAEAEDVVTVYQIGKTEKALDTLSNRIADYVSSREEGHTARFLKAAMTNNLETVFDSDLLALLKQKPLLPISSIQIAKSGTQTNRAGLVASHSVTVTTIDGKITTNEQVNIPKTDQISRWVSYRVTDDEIIWIYNLHFNADGSLNPIFDVKEDAKNYDPKYKKVMQEVEVEIEAEKKKSGNPRWFDSDTLKQKKLKERGIKWRSSFELNPNIRY